METSNDNNYQQILSKRDILFLTSFCLLYSGFKSSFEHNSFRKNLFPSAISCWDSRHFLRKTDQNFKFVWNIGYGDSYLEFPFHHSKIFGLHALLHDAVGAKKTQCRKGPGYCYMVGRGSNSSFLGQVTGLLTFFNVKLLLLSILNTVEFMSCVFCILKDIELADINVFKELEGLNDGNVLRYSFCPPRKLRTHKASFLVFIKIALNWVLQWLFGLQ